MNKMQALITTTLLFGISTGGLADVQDGLNAHKIGDYKTAFKEFMISAEAGNAPVQSIVGDMYRKGIGTLKDEKKAVEWYRKAAENGDESALNSLGVMYSDGSGVLKNDKKSFILFEKAAKKGDADSQYNLGVLYVNGRGTLKNFSKAKYWINKAYDNSHKGAAEFWDKYELWKY